METLTMTSGRSVAVKEMQDAYLIDVRSPTLDLETSADVRTACLHGLERGVSHVFVDLTGVTAICDEATDLLEAAAEELLAKDAMLWFANHDEAPQWRPVPAEGLTELAGLSPAFDSALTTAAGSPELLMEVPHGGY